MKNVDKLLPTIFKVNLLILAVAVVVIDIAVSYFLFIPRASKEKVNPNRNALDFSKIIKNENPVAENSVSQNPTEKIKISDNLSISSDTAKAWQGILDNIPLNPTEASATVSGAGEITFSWTGDKAREPGTKIIGYYVYFGPKDIEIPFPDAGFENSVNPKGEGVFVKQNSFVARELVKGQTYNLYIESVTDSKNPNIYYRFGMETVGFMKTLSAKKLFTYKYQ